MEYTHFNEKSWRGDTAKPISIWLTTGCNLSCKYCFQDSTIHKAVSTVEFETIDKFSEFCRRNNYTHIHFFGGEPLLAQNEFIYTIEKLYKSIPGVSFELVTNGTLIDDEIMSLIEAKEIAVLLSLDGNKERHNKFRGGFQAIEKWFPRLTKLKDIYVAMQLGEVEGMYSNLKTIWHYGFKRVAINILENYGYYSTEDISKFEKEYEKAIQGMLKGEGELACALDLLDQQEVTEYKKSCGATREAVACDVRGNLFPCFRFVELGNEFVIGNIWEGIDEEKNIKIRRTIESEINKYPYFYEDSMYCPVSLYQNTNRFDSPPPAEWCEGIEIKHKLIAKYYYNLRKYISLKI